MLTLTNPTAGGTPGIRLQQTNGFNSGGGPGEFQFFGPDFDGTMQQYALLGPGQLYQKTGAFYGDYEMVFANNSNGTTGYDNFIVGGVATQYPLPLTAVTIAGGGAAGATSGTLGSATGWPTGALDLYGFIASTNNANNLDEEFVHITNVTGATITFSATKAAHTTGTGAGGLPTISILEPTQGPAIYHAPANGSFYSGAANGTDTQPISLGCGASPWPGIYLNPNIGPELAGTTYQITKNDVFVVAQKAVTYTLPPLLPVGTIPMQGQVVVVFANLGAITLNTSSGDTFWDASGSKTVALGHTAGYIGISQLGTRAWYPFCTV